MSAVAATKKAASKTCSTAPRTSPVYPAILRRAIKATFARRQTPLPAWLDPLGDAFANDATKQTQWAAFIRRNGLTGLPGHFAEVVVAVRDYLAPVLRG